MASDAVIKERLMNRGTAKSSLSGVIRGTEHRGTGSTALREQNVNKGNFVAEIPDRNFRALGLDIGSTDFKKTGVEEGFHQARDAWLKNPSSEVVIRGSVSNSVRTGRSDTTLAHRRAESAKAMLVKQGVPKDRIRIEDQPDPRLRARGTDPKNKPLMRGASIEVVPPPRRPHHATIPPDRSSLVESAPNITAIGNLKQKAKVAGKLAVGVGAIMALPEILEYMAINWAAAFLAELIEAAVAEYGAEKMEKYVRDKLSKRLKDKLNERDTSEQRRFMEAMRRKIIGGGLEAQGRHHPLFFLIDPVTQNWVARRGWRQFAIQAGHVLSHMAGGFSFALEDAIQNQRWRADTTESKGIPGFSAAIKIGDVPIDLVTAREYEKYGWLPPGTCARAPYTIGWIDF